MCFRVTYSLSPLIPLAFSAHGENRGGRFQNVTELRLAGLDVTDATSRLLVRYLPHLTKLDLSQCGNITDQTIHTLTSPISPLRESLTHVNLAGVYAHTHTQTRCSTTQSGVLGSGDRCSQQGVNQLQRSVLSQRLHGLCCCTRRESDSVLNSNWCQCKEDAAPRPPL